MKERDEGCIIKGWRVRHTNCGVCRSSKEDCLWTKDEFRYVRCRNCKTVRVDPQLLTSEVAKIYSMGFQSKLISNSAGHAASSYHRNLLKRMEAYRQLGHILDVGCFTGDFLYAAKGVGWKASGLEISMEAVETARNQFGLDVRCGSLLGNRSRVIVGQI